MRKDLSIFGPIWVGSGARGFYGEAYWFHHLFTPGIRAAIAQTTLAAKTVTRYRNEGKMPLTERWLPQEWFPRCIRVNFLKGAAINAVGLANPGIETMLASAHWQIITEPFFISLMPIGPEETQAQEIRECVALLALLLPFFRSRWVGIQLNLTCPNVGAKLSGLWKKAAKLLPLLAPLGIPVVVKINVLVAPEEAAEIATLPGCDGLCVSNTVPYGELPFDIQWDELFGEKSPLEKMGGGGLSGAPIFPLVEEWVHMFRSLDTRTYINACGGIMCGRDVRLLRNAGANSVSIATAIMLRPWRVPEIVRCAQQFFT